MRNCKWIKNIWLFYYISSFQILMVNIPNKLKFCLMKINLWISQHTFIIFQKSKYERMENKWIAIVLACLLLQSLGHWYQKPGSTKLIWYSYRPGQHLTSAKGRGFIVHFLINHPGKDSWAAANLILENRDNL